MKVPLKKILAFILRVATSRRVKIYPRLITFVLVLQLAVLYLAGSGHLDAAGNVIGEDFTAFFATGKMYLSGDYEHFYDIEAHWAFRKAIAGQDAGVSMFLNPPYTALFYAPFAHGTYFQGLFLWWGAGVAALFVVFAALKTYLFQAEQRSVYQLAGMALLFPPTLVWFAYGQASAFILLILSLSFLLLRAGKDFSAGLILGLLAFKPQLALPLVLPIILKFRRRAILGGMLGSALWLSVGMYVFPEQMLHYGSAVNDIVSFISHPGFPFWGVHSLYGFIQLLLRGTPLEAAVNGLVFVITGALLVFLLLCLHKQEWRPGDAQWDLHMAASMVLGLCCAVHLYTYDLMLLLLPFFIVLHVFEKQGPRLDEGPVFAATVLLYLGAFLSAALTKWQLFLMETLGLPAVGIQISTLLLLLWSMIVLKTSHSGKS